MLRRPCWTFRAIPPSPTASCRPREVVAAAAEAGVTTLALTDHDGIDGVAEAAEAAASAGIALVPATEMSCVHGSIDDMHMLGYWVDTIAIAPACQRAQRERITRAEEIVERLNAQGVPVRFEDAIAQAGDASSVGRPHIAKAAGVEARRDGRLLRGVAGPGGARRSSPAAGRRRRGHRDHPRRRRRGRPRPSLLGHERPGEVAALIDDLDLDGVECFYPSHDRAQTKFLLDALQGPGLGGDGLL